MSSQWRRFRHIASPAGQCIIMIALTMQLSGCITNAQVRQLTAPVVLENDDISATIDYLPPPVLNARYRVKLNPFIAPPMFVTPVEFLVFNVTIRNMTDDRLIDLESTELWYGDTSYRPLSPSSLTIFWETMDATEDVKGPDRVQFFRLIETELATRSGRPVEDTAAGLLVFRGRFPKSGSARLTFSITEVSGDRPTRHSVRFFFDEYVQPSSAR